MSQVPDLTLADILKASANAETPLSDDDIRAIAGALNRAADPLIQTHDIFKEKRSQKPRNDDAEPMPIDY